MGNITAIAIEGIGLMILLLTISSSILKEHRALRFGLLIVAFLALLAATGISLYLIIEGLDM